MRHALCLVLSLLPAGGCARLFADVVHQPKSVIVNQLHYMPNAANLMALPQRFPSSTLQVTATADEVNWTYSLGGKEVCRFTAHVADEGQDRSTVWTTSEDISSDGQGFLCGAVNVAGKESVAATIEGRAADRQKVETELAAVVVTNYASMQKSIAKEMTDMAPPKTQCREYGSQEMQDACRTREFLRDHERQQQGR